MPKLDKFLYKNKNANGTLKYVIRVHSLYVAARADYDEIMQIYNECKEHDFKEEELLRIKAKYREILENNKMRFIHQNQLGFYFIQRGRQYYCCSESLEEILEYKRLLLENDWDKGCLVGYHFRRKHNLPKYIQRTRTGGYSVKYNRQHWGVFKTLEEAVEERDWLIDNDWDYGSVDLY